MDPGHYALLLLAVGLAVLVIEVFVPSGGLLAALSMCCLGGSLFCAVWEWWGENMLAFWAYVGCTAVLIPATLGGSFYMLPRTEFGRRLLQEAPTPEETASFTEERAALAAAIGRRGKTLTLHNPGGLVEVDGARFHSEARGPMLDAGEPIEVVGTRGNRLLVRYAKEEVPPALRDVEGPAAGTPPGEPREAENPVDPVIDPDPGRPGGRLDADAPVGYAHESPPPKPPPTDLEEASSPEDMTSAKDMTAAKTDDGRESRKEEPEEIADPFAADAEREGIK
ncbi:NfeD family protein [Alienimonas sp. DA493]|uniref:NfeD family protein n=1 Tax=Alienimonas sp. DA493 TaxID=3373605 RepID=UPI003754E61A